MGRRHEAVLFLTLLSNLFFPWGVALDNTPVALVIALIALAIKLVVFVGAIALLETSVAKLRLFRVLSFWPDRLRLRCWRSSPRFFCAEGLV